MVKLGWFLVPKWIDLNLRLKGVCRYDHVDEMVKGELDYDDSLSLNSGDHLTLKRTSFS